jgi:hypothetical protein
MKTHRRRSSLATMLGAFVLALLLLGAFVVGSVIYGAQQPSGAVHITVGQAQLDIGTPPLFDCTRRGQPAHACPKFDGILLFLPFAGGRTLTTMRIGIFGKGYVVLNVNIESTDSRFDRQVRITPNPCPQIEAPS